MQNKRSFSDASSGSSRRLCRTALSAAVSMGALLPFQYSNQSLIIG
jgi:hypothetical protein